MEQQPQQPPKVTLALNANQAHLIAEALHYGAYEPDQYADGHDRDIDESGTNRGAVSGGGGFRRSKAQVPALEERFVKKQQVRWTEAGAHRLLQLRTQGLNGDWRGTLPRWSPGMQATPKPR
jgi:hypothetical protein